ncbi:MAG: hypothetical protein HY916_12795 [Desulfovibrio sp.]|jgi:beta-lactamase superfamily II metal-dependent hydrolase|nr:hypothetical protein [Desulfovibrio sp.]
MKLTIHDVGHGQCISLVHENGNVILWDCGHSDWCNPATILYSQGIKTINRLFITNYDEDHISDLPNIISKFTIKILHRNRSVTAEQLRKIKQDTGYITDSMQSMLGLINTYATDVRPEDNPAFPNVSYTCYCNKYGAEFSDTNNISLVTVIKCSGTKFIIPGDVETAGWENLLKNDTFRADISDVDYFIASHHGRENGYCEAVFSYCKPKCFIFSDSNVQHATQETTNKYNKHASGITFNGETRYVLTTRNDNSLTWSL